MEDGWGLSPEARTREVGGWKGPLATHFTALAHACFKWQINEIESFQSFQYTFVYL